MTDTKSNLVGKLNDNCFVFASESLSELCRMIESETGDKPTISDLCQVLAESLRCCRGDLLRDVSVLAVEKITAKLSAKKKITTKPGDIFAIPRERGGYYFVIYITSNRFGEAFGVFDGFGQLPRLPQEPPAAATFPPMYTGKAFLTNGRWQRIAQREDLLRLFPSSPEIFHSKQDNPSNDDIGTYGSAERPTGELRNLTQHEAAKIGLDRRIYRQVMLEEQFEMLLQSELG